MEGKINKSAYVFLLVDSPLLLQLRGFLNGGKENLGSVLPLVATIFSPMWTEAVALSHGVTVRIG